MSEAASPSQGPGGLSATGSYIAQAAGGSTAIVAVFQAAAPRAVEPAEVAAAEALLAALPLDPLPEPGGLPPGSVMPWPRNRFFVGREPELRTLARQLKEGGTAAIGQSPAVTGLGGQGKTQLAVELAYRVGRWFAGGVFWVSCAEPASIPDAVAALWHCPLRGRSRVQRTAAARACGPGRLRLGEPAAATVDIRQLRGRGHPRRLGAEGRRLPTTAHGTAVYPGRPLVASRRFPSAVWPAARA